MAPEVGLEPTTLRLTAECSAIELLRIAWGTLRPGWLLLISYNKAEEAGQSVGSLRNGDCNVGYG
jgi:hypothetical protein